jgi:hypothetical protein
MFFKKLAAPVFFSIFLASAIVQNSVADQSNEQMAKGIAAILALSLLAKSAAASANADRNKDRYDYDEKLGGEENAVAACIHRAYRNLLKAGGLSLRLDDVKSVVRKNENDLEVVIQVTEFHEPDDKKRTIVCIVDRNQIVKFTS